MKYINEKNSTTGDDRRTQSLVEGTCAFDEDGILQRCVCGNTVEAKQEPRFYVCDEVGNPVQDLEFELAMSADHY